MGRVTDWLSEWSLQNKCEWTRSRWIVWGNGGTHGQREKFIKVLGKKKKACASYGPERSWILLEYLLDVPTTMSVSPHHAHSSYPFQWAKMKQGFKSEPTSPILEWSLWQQHPRAREKGTAYPKSSWEVQLSFVTIFWPHWLDSHTNDI